MGLFSTFAHPCSSGQEMQWIDHVEMYTSKRPPVEKDFSGQKSSNGLLRRQSLY